MNYNRHLVTTQHSASTERGGFALLLTILIISVVITVTLTMISVSIKQVQLSVDTRDSEIAFHAANAGLECMRHWRRAQREVLESGAVGDGLTEECFEVGFVISPDGSFETGVNLNEDGIDSDEGASSVQRYRAQATWGSGDAQRCSQIQMVLLNNSPDSTINLTISNQAMRSYIQGYPQTSNDLPTSCEPGGRCTIFSSQGFSNACPGDSNLFPLGTVQRDILVEF